MIATTPLLRAAALALLILCVTTPALTGTDPLPSWNEGAAKARIIAFVGAVIEDLYGSRPNR